MAFWKKLPRPDPGAEEKFRRDLEKEGIHVGWKDKLAMLLSAFLVLFLPAALIVLVLALGVLALFGAL